MDIILSASIIAAFLAGMVALFAPCCITVLLPDYLASTFRQKRNILRMTLVFFSGIAVVLIPIGLGAAALAEVFRDFHKELYLAGGLFMILLAVFSVLGKSINIVPMSKRIKPSEGGMGVRSIFMLGVFSGAATSCCAPVLAGAVTLAVISGTFWKALIVTFAYVFGMVIPLFIAGYFYDKFKIEKSKLIVGKTLEFKLGSKNITVHSTNLLAAVIFLVMGAILLSLAYMGGAYWAPEYQIKFGEALNRWSNSAFESLRKAGDAVWGIVLVLVFGFFVYKAERNSKK